jgi:hypothetical protein
MEDAINKSLSGLPGFAISFDDPCTASKVAKPEDTARDAGKKRESRGRSSGRRMRNTSNAQETKTSIRGIPLEKLQRV